MGLVVTQFLAQSPQTAVVVAGLSMAAAAIKAQRAAAVVVVALRIRGKSEAPADKPAKMEMVEADK